MKMTNRLDALEGKASPPLVEKWHQLVALGDETEDELIDAYGRQKIGPNDSFIIFRTVAPAGEANEIRRIAAGPTNWLISARLPEG